MSNRNDATHDIIISHINRIWYCEPRMWERKPSGRMTNGIAILLAGEIRYDFPECSITAREGDLLNLPRGTVYGGIQTGGAPSEFYVVEFETLHDDEMERFILPNVITVKNPSEYIARFEKLMEIWRENAVEKQLRCRTLLYELIVCLRDEVELPLSSQMREILAYVNENLSRPDFMLRDICDKFFVSESTLRRNFHKAIGVSPVDYIRECRLSMASDMLDDGELSVKEAAERCGFSSAYYFSKCFSERFGVPPSRYKGSGGI